jgi:hypothetical protein
MFLRKALGVAGLAVVLSLSAMTAQAQTLISGPLGDPYGTTSNVDFTYSGPNGPLSGTTYTVLGGNQGYYNWANASSLIGAEWVSAFNNGQKAAAVNNLTGDFVYTITFNSVFAGAGIHGSLFSDDYITEIKLNGDTYTSPFGSIYTPAAGVPWLNVAGLNIGSGVVSGVNTLSFKVNNSGQNTAGIAFNLKVKPQQIPEPGTLVLMGGILLGAGASVLRRRGK